MSILFIYRAQKKSEKKQQNKAFQFKIIRDIRDIFEHKEQNYYEQVRVEGFPSNNYIEYESNDDRNKIILITNTLIKINHT